MKNHKKLLAMTCIGLLCMSTLYGCKPKNPEKETQSESQTETPKQPVTEKQTEKQTETQKQTEPQTEKQTERQTETQKQTEPQSESQRNPDSGSSSKEEERYFFDEAGNTIYVSQNSSGNWVDKNGNSYTFYENGVKDSNGTQYYYDPPEYRNDSGVPGTDTGEAVDLYRNDGKLVRLTKNANGDWADSNGVTYTLRDDGAMDSNGEFHPW